MVKRWLEAVRMVIERVRGRGEMVRIINLIKQGDDDQIKL